MKRLIIALILCGAALSCSNKYKYLVCELPITYKYTPAETQTHNAIAKIIEDKLSEHKNTKSNKIYWATVVIMDVSSGYTRTINCVPNDKYIGYAGIDYAEELYSPLDAFLPFPFMRLLDEGNMQSSDAVEPSSMYNFSNGTFIIPSSHTTNASTLEDALIQGSCATIAQKYHEKFNGDELFVLSQMGYDEISSFELLKLYNIIANNGKYIDTKDDKSDPTKILNDSYYSQRAVSECKKCMVQHAIDKGLKDIALYSGEGLFSDKSMKSYNSTYVMTYAGFFPIDNPKYSILVSFNTKQHMALLGKQVLPAIIEELNKEQSR